MPYITTDDLKTQALWMSGEPTDGTSDYDAQVLTYLQNVYDVLVTGGTFGVRDIAASAGLYEHVVDIAQTDWIWLRKQPVFAFNTTPAAIGSAAPVPLNQGVQIGTATFTYGAVNVNFSIAPFWLEDDTVTSVQGGRIMVLNQAQGVPNPPSAVPRIASHNIGDTFALLDAGWPQETQTVSNFVIFRAEYPVPTDFERFCEAWKCHGGFNYGEQPVNVGSYEQVMDLFPVTNSIQGPPSAAARMDPTTLMLNRWDTFSYRIEGSYIFKPDDLVVGATPQLQQPLVPTRWRRVLAFGAAMLIMQDKVDSRMGQLASQFREIISSMSDEYRKEQNSGSELSGRMLYRRGGRGSGYGAFLRTRSGLPFWP